MKRFAFIALLLGLGLVAGCDNKPKTPAKVETTPPADAPDKAAPATTDGAAAPEKTDGDKDDMPDDEKDK